MAKPVLKLIAGDRYDIGTSAAALCAAFDLGVHAEQRVADCLAHIDNRRFAVPYDDGLQLALARPFGAELRNLVAQPGLTSEKLYSLDYRTCDEAGMLELVDRLGLSQTWATLAVLPVAGMGINVSPLGTRVDPASFDDVMPLMREALGRIYNDLTGATPNRRRDFTRKNGAMIPTAGRMGSFICRGLSLAGWSFEVKKVSYNYDSVLSPMPWGRKSRVAVAVDSS